MQIAHKAVEVFQQVLPKGFIRIVHHGTDTPAARIIDQLGIGSGVLIVNLEQQ